MDPITWERLSETLADALELEPQARAALLAQRLGHDEALLSEGRRLLALEDRAARLEPRRAAAAGEERPDPWLGRAFGPWRAEARLGSGGMGTVYRARRAADGLRAALKVLHAGLALSPSGRRRFHNEQRALARLEHPGIARLIDGGVTDAGLSYLAMEYVEGRALDRYAREEDLDLRARVRLFGEVCAAVEYAHQHLVVHRDLKPSNVVVDERGRARLLDFGIAKLLDDDETGDVTRTGERALTPRYASPEQVRGAPLSTQSDVYSLGVVLYELLCGQPPYAIAGRSAAEVERAVCDESPRAPSTVVAAGAPTEPGDLDRRRVRRQLAGDLDRIVLRALAKEPERRYASAGELWDDLERWRAGLPVRARGDGALYRLSRFVARNRLATGAAALLAASLLAGAAAVAREARAARRAEAREREQRQVAEQRFEQTRELVGELVFGVHDHIERLVGATPVRRFLIERTQSHLERLSADGELGPALRGELAATWMRLAQVQGTRTVGGEGDVEGALASTLRALALYRAALVDTPLDLELLDDCADAVRQLGDLERLAGRHAEALACYTEVEELARRGLERTPDHAGLRRQLALAANQRGRVLQQASRNAEALLELGRARELALELLHEGVAAREIERDLHLIELRLADASSESGRPAEALALSRSALERAERLAAAAPDDQQSALDVCTGGLYVARGLLESGRVDEALVLLEPHLERAAELAALDPHNQVARALEVEALEVRGAGVLARGDVPGAARVFEDAAARAEARLEVIRGDRLATRSAARLHLSAGEARRTAHEPSAAQAHFERALELLGSSADEAPDERVRFGARVGLCDLELERAPAEASLEELETLQAWALEQESRFPDSGWPLRHRGLVDWRLGMVHERLGSEIARPREQRLEHLRLARERFEAGLSLSEGLAERGWLTHDELRRDVPALFAADVERVDASLAELGAPWTP